MKIGFVGTGTITEAMVTGIFQAGCPVETVLVSPRNRDTSARLALRFPGVLIAEDNQEVVDESDVLFLAVRPQIAEDVIKSLRFKADQQVVSVIATLSPPTLAAWIDQRVQITQAIPLPFLAHGLGATAIYPPNRQIGDIFGKMGPVVEVETISQFELFSAASAVMGTYFGTLDAIAHWLDENGIAYADAAAYLRQLYAGLSHAAISKAERSFEDLRLEFSTRGGINEQVFRVFHQHGGVDAMRLALDAALQRIRTQRHN